MSRQESFEPKILGFLCNWCSYAGADLAGVSRFQYPPNLRVIRVMCSGRVDPALVVEAFIHRIDGVMGDPTCASAESGEKFFNAIVNRISQFISDFAAGKTDKYVFLK